MNSTPEQTGFRCGMIAIVGRPNVGKSTLMNALVGQKVSITSRKAQTTRHRITGIRTLDDAQFIFVDTPGFQTRHSSVLNRSLNRAVTSTLTSVDVVLFVVEADRFGPDDQKVLDLIPPSVPTLLIANKVDKVSDKCVLLPFLKSTSALRGFRDVVPMSAKQLDDIARLFEILRPSLPFGEPIYGEDDLTDRSERFLAAEILREKVFRWTGDELPYTSTVLIDKFEQEGRLRRIFSTILVDRDGHKAMIIGRKGAKLKQISTEARIDMEKLFDDCAPMDTSDVWLNHPDNAGQPEAGPEPVRVPTSGGEPPSAAGRTTPTRRRTAPRSDNRIAEQPGFVLHSYPYRETSLIIDVFTRAHGRLALVAKGAKRPHSALRGVLQTFQPLALSWVGKSEMRTLTKAEWVGGMRPLTGDALLCGFYVNELLVKFCAREDPHTALFDHYLLTLTRLAHDEPAVQVLRSFERVLLRETDGRAKQDLDALSAQYLSWRCAARDAPDPDRPAKPMNVFSSPPPVIELGVNIDHVATLRNVRGTAYPDPLRAALQAEAAGADAITLHLREDRRHIVDADVRALRPLLSTRMNLECALTQEMLDIACDVRPHDVCLVPEKRAELTTEGGLDVVAHFEAIQAASRQLADAGSRVSLFIDAEPEQIRAAHESGAPVIELHTGRYADAQDDAGQRHEFERIAAGVDLGLSLGLKVNAGHGLHYTNVQRIAALDGIAELNIGHAIVAHAIFSGWDKAVREMKAIMVASRVGARTRIAAVMERTGGRFADKILGPDELAVYRVRAARSAARGVAFLATRFCAKEAFSKAIGLGVHWPMTWRSMQTLNEKSGKPVIVTSGELAQWMAARRLSAHVSVSDERDYAVSFVIAESDA
ncbi:hypothetical protein DFQ30_010134 [Apophysomyces sp. BC1015]|nr:hypothetical protein DFQ30_010134 [Apophysomyces sp. BC1015]